MQRLPKQLVPTAQLTNAVATYYTALALVTSDISSATATNVTAGAVSVTVYIVASGGAAGPANIVVQTKSVPANSAVQLWELIGQKVPPGATIQALASAGASINLSVGGYEVIA